MADELSGRELLQQVLQAKRASEREAMSLAGVASFVDNHEAMMRSGRRMEAQVDAALKAKYEACGQKGAYEPPDSPNEDGMATLINCTFNGDKAVQQIAHAYTEIGTEGEGHSHPDPGDRPPAQPTKPTPLWKKILAAATLVAVGAGTVLAASYFFGDDPASYEITALPYKPAE